MQSNPAKTKVEVWQNLATKELAIQFDGEEMKFLDIESARHLAKSLQPLLNV